MLARVLFCSTKGSTGTVHVAWPCTTVVTLPAQNAHLELSTTEAVPVPQGLHANAPGALEK